MSLVEVTIDGSAGAANAREIYGQALVELAHRHPEVVALTADLMLSHQLKGFKQPAQLYTLVKESISPRRDIKPGPTALPA